VITAVEVPLAQSWNLTTSQALGVTAVGVVPHQGGTGYPPAAENAVTAILARRFFGSCLLATLRELDSPCRPTGGAA